MNQSEIARAAGVSTATVSRWFSRSTQPLAPQVIAVARAYGESPVVALVAAGYLTREEIEHEVKLTPGMSLGEFSELEIAQELVRRIEAGETTEVSETPLEVDHPAWLRDARFPDPDAADVSASVSYWAGNDGEFKLHISTDEGDLRFFDTQGNEFKNWKQLVSRVVEQLPSAAKHTATEVKEDDHTP